MAGWAAIYNNANYSLRQHALRLAALQEQAASGARVNRPSDAPNDAYRILRLRAQMQSIETYGKNLDHVVRDLEMAHSVLSEISNAVTEAKQVLTQASGGIYGEHNQPTFAARIDSILEQAFSLANTQSLGRYVFAGTHAAAAPFLAERVEGRIVRVDYQGGYDDLPVPVAAGVEHPGLLIGRNVFGADNRGDPVFHGRTGAAPGTATSSARGNVTLLITHAQTVYAGGSGIQPGAGSPGGDGIIGEHVLTVDKDLMTLSLDGGDPVSFTGAETDLAVDNAAGDRVHVDMTGWVDFDGDVTCTATGKLSIDGGASTTDLTAFTDNVAVTHADTGRVLYVDTTDVLRTGVEPVRIPGTHDLFGALIHIRDVLNNEHDFSDQKQRELLDLAMGSLDEVSQTIVRSMTGLGGRLQAIDVLKDSMQSIEARAAEQASALQDADVVEVATDLARTQTLYEMTLAVTSKLLQITLLDYI